MPDEDRILGVLLGTAVGDAIGLPFEGLGPARVERRLRARPLRHSLLFGRGMISDDTQHACMVARALLDSNGEVDRFRRSFASQLRGWLLAAPPALGLGTLRACLRLCVGLGPQRSGVASAGNGPTMRAALFGVWTSDHAQQRALVRASTRITHTDPRAEDGALLIAGWASGVGTLAIIRDVPMRERIAAAIDGARAGLSLEQARVALGFERGVSGFVVDTLAAVGFCWQRYRDDPRAAIEAAVRLGGDTDTVAAIVGALIGAELGGRELARRLPNSWIDQLRDWPIGVPELHELAAALARGDRRAARPAWIAELLRNFVFVLVILTHGFARLVRR
jgi:ADP-ribosyl-[dinitrogen reductase] hydrolase